MTRHLLALLLFLLALPALAAPRSALVIGNCLYDPKRPIEEGDNLPNACKDARLMRDALKAKGFEVIHEENLDGPAMKKALVRFKNLADKGGAGFFYYAGHAVQHRDPLRGDLNYLLPVRTDIDCDLLDSELPQSAITAQGVLDELQGKGVNMKIVVLDACRDNPLQCTRSLGGLAPMVTPRGAVIAYAADAGHKAYDGSGFTPALAAAMQSHAHLPVDQMIRIAGRQVWERTNARQRPWVNANMEVQRDFCLGTCGAMEDEEKERLRQEKARMEQELSDLRLQLAQVGGGAGLDEVLRRLQEVERAVQQQGAGATSTTTTTAPKTTTTTQPSITPPATRLRATPATLSDEQMKAMLEQRGFFDSVRHKEGKGLANDFVKHPNGTVTDRTTGLMWQQGGSPKTMNYAAAQAYVKKLNEERFGGYNDWRLPTLEEGASLLEPSKRNGDLYIDPVFDPKQRWIWTSDPTSEGSAAVWYVTFYHGYVYWYDTDDDYFVRVCRAAGQ
jgi:hypothetical protein